MHLSREENFIIEIPCFSLKRDLKWQAAKETREELKKKYNEIQLENMKRYQSSQMLSEYRANWALEWKKKLLLEKNKMKMEHHYYILNKWVWDDTFSSCYKVSCIFFFFFFRLKDEDRQKEIQARQQLESKEAKLRYIREKKESAISRSRMNCKIAAELRQKIKSSYNL